MTTVDRFLGKLGRLAAEIPRDANEATSEAAQFVKGSALREMRRVAPSQRLKAGRLNVSYNMQRQGSSSTARVKATGPWQLIENDTQHHRIVSRRAGGTRARRSAAGIFGPIAPGSIGGGRRAVVKTPYGPRRYVRHPGTRGQHPWRKAMLSATPRIGDSYQRALRNALAREFR